MEKFARKCDVTGRGMNTGWVWGDGTFYTSTLDITINELRKDIKNGAYEFDEISNEEALELSDDDLLEYAFEYEILYYTEWEEVDEDEWYDEDGNEYNND